MDNIYCEMRQMYYALRSLKTCIVHAKHFNNVYQHACCIKRTSATTAIMFYYVCIRWANALYVLCGNTLSPCLQTDTIICGHTGSTHDRPTHRQNDSNSPPALLNFVNGSININFNTFVSLCILLNIVCTTRVAH